MRLDTSKTILIGSVALALSFGAAGGAVAQSLITGKDIKDGSIKSEDLGVESVSSRTVVDGSLKAKDLSATTREQFTTFPEVTYVVVTLTATGSTYVPAPCPAGTKPLSANVLTPHAASYSLGADYISESENAVMIKLTSNSGNPETADVQVVCLG